jgi:hypothetical protein
MYRKRRWVKATLTTAVPGPWFVHISLVYNFEKSQSKALSQAFLAPSLIGCIVTTSSFFGVVAPTLCKDLIHLFPNILAVRVFSLSRGLSVLKLCRHIL